MAATIESRNAWRQETPGSEGWEHSPRPGAANKYFMVSTDNHAQEPNDIWDRVDEKYRDRTPRIKVDEDGTQWLISEAGAPQRVKPGKGTEHIDPQEKFENFDVMQPYTKRMEEEDVMRASSGIGIEPRQADMERDGIDAEIIYPQKGMIAWASPDPVFANAMCSAWNRWAYEVFGEYFGKHNPCALIVAGDVEGAMKEIAWAAERGFKSLAFGNRPVYGPDGPDVLHYNDKIFEPLWALVEETGLPINFHVSTGKDPRAVRGNGGAIINYVCNSMQTTSEPLIKMIASGVFERYPKLIAGSVEAGIGWIPWTLDAMDHGYRAHHMWVRPVIPELPSFYFRRNCFATFMIDRIGVQNIERADIVDNVLWANDYPHHEGTWPHSAAAIERQMGDLSDEMRAKVLGLNAARIYDIDVPAKFSA